MAGGGPVRADVRGLMAFEIEGFGGAQILRRLSIAQEALADMGPVWDMLHERVITSVKEQYRTQGSHGGTPWPGYESEPKYAGRKRGILHGGPEPVLRWAPGGPGDQPARSKERLYPSLTQPSHPEHIYRKSKKGFETGSAVPYARRLHDGGFQQPWDEVTAPGRKILVLSKKDKAAMSKAIQRWVHEAMKIPGKIPGTAGTAVRRFARPVGGGS